MLSLVCVLVLVVGHQLADQFWRECLGIGGSLQRRNVCNEPAVAFYADGQCRAEPFRQQSSGDKLDGNFGLRCEAVNVEGFRRSALAG